MVKTSICHLVLGCSVLWGSATSGWTQTATPTNAPKAALKFDAFKVGSKVYSNVTVISRTSSDVFVRHQSGISNFKVDELSNDLLEKLGYLDAKEAEKAAQAQSGPKLQEVVSRTLDVAQNNEALVGFANKLKAQIRGEGGGPAAAETGENPSTLEILQNLKAQLPQSAMAALSVFLVSLPLLYFFFCYTARLVCKKAGSEPGFLIWVPLLSLVPLLKAARMPGWLAVLWFIPFVNLVVTIFWCIRIAKARGKGVGTTLALLFPVTSPAAWLYLAYSK